MSYTDPIVDDSGRSIAPPQPVFEARPSGPWNENRAALRGRGVRQALAGEIPVRVDAALEGLRLIEEWERIEREGAILRMIFNEDPVSTETLAELAMGRRS